MAHVSQTASIIERALEETIAHVARGQQSPKARAILIEARRLRSMVASWAAIPPRATTRRELYQNAMKLFQKAGVEAPPVDPASFPDPTLRPTTSSPPARGLTHLDEPGATVSSTPPPSGQGGPGSSRPRRRTELAPGVLLVHPDAFEWRELPGASGVTVKVLHRDDATGIFRALMRMEAGATLPRHRHAADEEIFVIEGSMVHEGVEARAGEYCHADPDTIHETILSPGGCTLFVVGSERDELLGHR